MIGIVVGLVLSWLVLRLTGHRLVDLFQGGLARNAWLLGGGLLVAGALAIAFQLAVIHAAGGQVDMNPDATVAVVLGGLAFVLKSVAFEELLFRGALLFLAIRWLGVARGVALSAGTFGVYHWFSFGILGQLTPMLYVLALTGITGAVWAWAFARSGTMALPVGLHLGWNLATIVVFSQGPIGRQLLVVTDTSPVGAAASVAFSVVQVLVIPAMMLLLVAALVRRWPIDRSRA